MDHISGKMPESTYVELVASLSSTLLPTSIMAVSFLGIGLVVIGGSPDRALDLLIIAGSIAAAARLAVLLLYRKRVDETLSFAAARRFERRFALAYFSFAFILGAFGARAFAVATPEAHMLVVGLLFGYGAGAAAGLSLRPWISVPTMLVAVLPTIIVAISYSNIVDRAAGILLAVFLAGGVESVIARYRSTARRVTMRRLLATLARSDPLTNLPNRLSLREHFDECVASGGVNMIAVHCLDLDRFKPVNDRYGHPVGDALLKAVSERLRALLRGNDIASRVGGDEFVIVQTCMSHAGEEKMLARRIVRAISQPYSIDGHEIVIGTSIGYAVSSATASDLDRLVALADAALCGVKRNGGGIAAYQQAIRDREIRLTA